MGGLGSGNWYRWRTKSLTTELRSIDVRRWAREGFLAEGRAFSWHWHREGESLGSLQVKAERDSVRLEYGVRDYNGKSEKMSYRVYVVSQSMPSGGHRKWFTCPARGCGRRVAILYEGRVFACRSCHQLAYPSTRELPFERGRRRAEALRARLGWDANAYGGYGLRPKGMHRRTFERLFSELIEVEREVERNLEALLNTFRAN